MSMDRYGGRFRQTGRLVDDEFQTLSPLQDLVDIACHHVLHLVHLSQHLARQIRRRAVEAILCSNCGITPTISTFSEEAKAVKQKGCCEYTASLCVNTNSRAHP